MTRHFGDSLRRAREGELGGLAGDTVYVGVWQGSAALADFVQIALITHALGLTEFGRFSLVVAVVALVGQFVQLRVGLAAVSFGATALDRDPRMAAGVFQLTYLIDLMSGIAGFVIIAILAATAGPHLIGGGSGILLILGALLLIVASPEQTSMAVLRLHDRFRLVAFYSAAIDACRVALVFGALVVFDTLAAVLIAVMLARLARGVANGIAALIVFHRAHPEVRLTRPEMSSIPHDERRPLRSMLLNTNVVGYARLAQVQVPTLLVGALAGATETGLYKVGMAAGTAAGKFIDPASAALLPRLARMWSAGRFVEVRRLIRNASILAVPAMIAALTAVILLRNPILEFLGGGPSAKAAGTVLILAAIGQTLYATVFWHSTLLYAARRAGLVAIVSSVAAVLQIAGVLILVPAEGATGAAVAWLVGSLLVNSTLLGLALRTLRRAVAADPQGHSGTNDASVSPSHPERPERQSSEFPVQHS